MGAKGETVLLSLIFLAVDNLIYGLLAVYLDNVVPSKPLFHIYHYLFELSPNINVLTNFVGQYGVKKHPLFFLSCISHAFDPHPDEKVWRFSPSFPN